MADAIIEMTEAVEGRMVRYSDRPIPFETFLDLAGVDEHELIDGVMVKRMAVQLTHEKLLVWLLQVLGLYVSRRDLGIVLGSRTAVQIGEYDARLPDLLFVRRDRLDIVRERAVYGAPDLVIELVSPNDRPSDLVSLIVDYDTVGVQELVFIDQQKRYLRVRRRHESGSTDETLITGSWQSEVVAGFHLDVATLFQDPRPDAFDTLIQLLAGT